MVKRKSPLTLKTLSVEAVGSVVLNTCCNLDENPLDNGYSATTCIQDMLSTVPIHLVNELFEEILDALIDFDKQFGILESENVDETVEAILTFICDSRITKFSFENLDMLFQDRVVECLHRMTGLHHLDLMRYALKRDSVMIAIAEMKNLTEFHHQNCTDNIISVLAHNCQNLQVLVVCASLGVTDVGLFKLINCKALRRLNVNDTSVSSFGCASVVTNVASLREISYWKFSPVLEELAGACPMNILDIKGCILFSELPIVEKLFPGLRRISVDMENGEAGDASGLVSLALKLKYLGVYKGFFYRSYISKMLDTLGLSLVHLALHNVECLHVNAIEKISDCCPNLTELEFSNCNKDDQSPLLSHYWSKAAFHKLQVLKIDTSAISFEFILSRSPNITYLEMINVPDLTGHVFVETLSKNPLTHLKGLHFITCVETITVGLILNLLRMLANLEILECNVDLNDIQSIPGMQNYIKRNNFDVAVKLLNLDYDL